MGLGSRGTVELVNAYLRIIVLAKRKGYLIVVGLLIGRSVDIHMTGAV